VLLPNHAEAIIAAEKLRDFLLNADHEYGRDRARILLRMGFERERWQELDVAIRRLIATNDAIESSGYEIPRFIVMGDLYGPTESRHFWTIWELAKGHSAPRFLSTYPRPQA
jgi:hypothetical protein